MDSARVSPAVEPSSDLEEQKEPGIEVKSAKENFKLELKKLDKQTKNVSFKSVSTWINGTGKASFSMLSSERFPPVAMVSASHKGEKKCGYMIVFVAFLASIVGLPVVMIIIGVYNLNNCSLEPRVPLWLLVDGSFVLGSAILNFFIIGSCIDLEDPDKSKILVIVHRTFYVIILLFQFIWSLLGKLVCVFF